MYQTHLSLHCGYFYWWLFCWSSASLISTFSAISTFRLVTFHRSATFCLNISTTVIFLSWWIHQLRENCYHRIKASLFHDKYWFTTAVFHSIKIIFVCRHKCSEKKNCDSQPDDDVSIRCLSIIWYHWFFFSLFRTLISTKLNICRKGWIVIMISMLFEHELIQRYFPQNTTYLSQMWFSQRRSHEM